MFDPHAEKTFEKHQTLKLMILSTNPLLVQTARTMPPHSPLLAN
jgi:hypothetical protein